MRLFLTRSVGVLALALAVGGPAQAQDARRQGTGAGGPALNTGGGLAPAGGAVDTSQGGVGGTGLGKLPPGSTEGKGLSVKGPAGQGIETKPAP